jgi:hypothetical protein
MAVLSEFQNHVRLYIDKYDDTMHLFDYRKAKAGEQIIVNARHAIDLTKEFRKIKELQSTYILHLEDTCVRLIRELYKERGLTPTDAEIINELQKHNVHKHQKIIRI